jgi:hypothetical protein
MNNLLMQCQAEIKVLEFKLDKIRTRLEERIKIADPITKAELQYVLDMISTYETVPYDWTLNTPFVTEVGEK